MTDVARHARRILDGARKGTAERIFPGYISFKRGERPSWWNDAMALDSWGDVLGVHENEPGVPVDAIVITEYGLAVFGAGGAAAWLAYTEVEAWDRLSKEPPSRSLRIRGRSGEAIELMFSRGGAFAFVQFLSSAMDEHARARRRSNEKVQ